jgi:polygalacturonase
MTRLSTAPLLVALALLIFAPLSCDGARAGRGPGASPAAGPQSPVGGAPVSAGPGTAAVVTYPDLPGALRSPLYTVTANGTPLFVEKLSKFAPEMQVHYAHCSLSGAGAATFSVTVNEAFGSHTLSPQSRNIATAQSGNTLTFESGPNYLILQVDAKELLFILIDAEETSPPRLGDANVKSIADYGVDNTGATLVTAQVQAAIDAASGAARNVLYFPPGKYTVGELWLRSDMTLYLAGGALLYGSNALADFDTGRGGINIEGCSHGMLRMYRVHDTRILGRGVIDANGKAIRAQNDTKVNLLKIEESSHILIDGITVRDPSFWNTLVYRSDLVTIQNYKMINCRPITAIWNNTDGVNFDESTRGKLSNAFLYTGDDSMATKSEEATGTVDTRDIVHEKVVCYSNSVCCKIGTKTMGRVMDGVVFRDIDVVKAGRALNIDAYDTAVVQNTRFEDIRIEAADASMIALSSDDPPSWRPAANRSLIVDTHFENVSSRVKKPINLHGRSSTVNIAGVHFENLTVEGKPVTSATDPDAAWSINPFVSGIDFDARR